MRDKKINPNTITGRINQTALDLLEENPDGLQWSELNKLILKSDETLHPKSVNGCVWKLTENFPDSVYKPDKGLFRHKKYKKL